MDVTRFPWRSTTSKGSEIACSESRLRFYPLNPDFLGFFRLPLEKKWEPQTGKWSPYVRPLSQYRGIKAVFFRRSFRVNAIDWSSRLRSLFVSLPREIVWMIAVREAEIIEFIPLRLLLAIGITVLPNSFYRSFFFASRRFNFVVFFCDFTRLQSNSFFFVHRIVLLYGNPGFIEIRRDASKLRTRKNQSEVSVSRFIDHSKRRDERESTASMTMIPAKM